MPRFVIRCAQHLITSTKQVQPIIKIIEDCLSIFTVWVPIMQITEDETFGYSSGYWTNDELLNENSSITDNINAKYAAFLNQPFSMIFMCTGSSDTNCVSHTFDRQWSNAKELFSAGHIRDPSINQPGILRVFGPEEGTYSVS